MDSALALTWRQYRLERLAVTRPTLEDVYLELIQSAEAGVA